MESSRRAILYTAALAQQVYTCLILNLWSRRWYPSVQTWFHKNSLQRAAWGLWACCFCANRGRARLVTEYPFIESTFVTTFKLLVIWKYGIWKVTSAVFVRCTEDVLRCAYVHAPLSCGACQRRVSVGAIQYMKPVSTQQHPYSDLTLHYSTRNALALFPMSSINVIPPPVAAAPPPLHSSRDIQFEN